MSVWMSVWMSVCLHVRAYGWMTLVLTLPWMVRLVHTAPGHGVDDFYVCHGHPHLNLPVICPVDDTGKYTADAGGDLPGLDVLTQGNSAVLKVKLVFGSLASPCSAPNTAIPSPMPVRTQSLALLADVDNGWKLAAQ